MSHPRGVFGLVKEAPSDASRSWVVHGEEIVETYLSYDDAVARLQGRFTKAFGIDPETPWTEVPKALDFDLDEGDVFEESYVSLEEDGETKFWIVKETKAK